MQTTCLEPRCEKEVWFEPTGLCVTHYYSWYGLWVSCGLANTHTNLPLTIVLDNYFQFDAGPRGTRRAGAGGGAARGLPA
jgi:hypothetical protein